MAGFQPGDFILYSCSISSARGNLDLSQGFLAARIYESIFVPNAIIELDVFDTNDAIGQLKILGDEIISISFSAPGSPVATYTFAMDVLSIGEITGTQKGKKYTCHGVGMETMFSKTNFVSKSYNTDISSIVTDIHNTFLKSSKALLTELSDGIQKLIIPNLRPFEAIDMVRRRAASSENPSSTFLYFENYEGFNFKTIEGLFKQSSTKTFVHGDAVGYSIYINTQNNIIDYEVPKIVSSTERIALGGLQQKTSTFDIRTRQYQTKTSDSFNSGFNSSFFNALYGIGYGIFHMIPVNTFNNPSHIPESTPQQLAFVSDLLQRTVMLRVNGDTSVKAGDMVTVFIPQAITTTGYQQVDPTISGNPNYLVSRLCRNIGEAHEKPRYTENLELITKNPPGDA